MTDEIDEWSVSCTFFCGCPLECLRCIPKARQRAVPRSESDALEALRLSGGRAMFAEMGADGSGRVVTEMRSKGIRE
jgi:hypothetical protein